MSAVCLPPVLLQLAVPQWVAEVCSRACMRRKVWATVLGLLVLAVFWAVPVAIAWASALCELLPADEIGDMLMSLGLLSSMFFVGSAVGFFYWREVLP